MHRVSLKFKHVEHENHGLLLVGQSSTVRRLNSVIITVLLCIAVTASTLFAQTQTPTSADYVSSINWSQDGSLIAYGTEEIPPISGDLGERSWTAQVKRNDGTIIFTRNFPYRLGNIEVSPSGDLIFIGPFREVFDLITQEIIISGSDSIAFIDGTWHLTQDVLLLTAIRGARTNDPVVRRSPSIFAGSNLPSTNAPDNWQTVTSIWSPDAQSAATSTSYGPIYVWDATIEVSPLLSTFSGHMAAVRNLVWNPTTNLIASGDDTGRIWVWNPETGQPVRELVGHTGAILDIDWRADGMQIVSTGMDSTLRTWDWPSGDMHIVQSGELISALAYSH
jgi:WD40 repeat protein